MFKAISKPFYSHNWNLNSKYLYLKKKYYRIYSFFLWKYKSEAKVSRTQSKQFFSQPMGLVRMVRMVRTNCNIIPRWHQRVLPTPLVKTCYLTWRRLCTFDYLPGCHFINLTLCTYTVIHTTPHSNCLSVHKYFSTEQMKEFGMFPPVI